MCQRHRSRVLHSERASLSVHQSEQPSTVMKSPQRHQPDHDRRDLHHRTLSNATSTIPAARRLRIPPCRARIPFGAMCTKWVASVGAAVLVAGCAIPGGTLAPLHSAAAPGGGRLPHQPRACQGWHATAPSKRTFRLGATLPFPTITVRVGASVRVIAANHTLHYAVPWVTKGQRFVCQTGFGGGPNGSTYLRVLATAPGKVEFLSFWRKVSPEAAPNLGGHLVIARP